MFPVDEQHSVRGRLADNLRATVSQRLLPRQDGAGLIPAVETMMVTLSVAEAIRDPQKTQGIRKLVEQGGVHGMQSFDQHLVELVRAKLISQEVAKTNASSPADLERQLLLSSDDRA
jgi:twitching motility protein PilT